MKRIYYLLLTVLFSIFFSCTTEEKTVEKPFVNPPLPALNPGSQTYTLNAEAGDTLNYKTGSVITIPPNVWVDTAGNKITGKIEIQYREFHDAYDIFLAGVPMAYDSAGVQQTLQTAGMFDIRAYKDSNEIFMNKENNINVKMASYDGKSGYNFYSLDEENKNWAYEGTASPQINTNIQLITDSIAKMQPEFTLPFSKNHFTLDYWAILDVYFNVAPSGNVWQYRNNTNLKTKSSKYGLKWSGIYGDWQTLFFKGRKRYAYEIVWENISGKRIPKSIQSKEYLTENRLIKLTNLGKNKYYMVVQDGWGDNLKKFSFKVKAVMKLKDLFKQMPDDWKAEYEITQSQIAKAKARLKAQAVVFRSFNINQTGFHNWDRVYHRDDKIIVEASFDFEDKELNKAGIPIVYFIENDKSYVQIPFHDWKKLMLVPDSTAKFVAILSETEIATFNNSEYQKLDFSALASSKKQIFNMKTFKIDSKKDFINSLN